MAEGWQFLLGNSENMEVIGPLKKARGRQLQGIDLNKSGSANFSFPTDETIAGEIKPWRTCIIAQFDDDWFWSGPVSSRVSDLAAGRMTVAALGWFELLMHRFTDTQETYTAQDAGSIAFELLNDANVVYPTHITPGTSELTQPRTVTYPYDTNVGQTIISLTDLESGYDWYIDPRTRQLFIVASAGQDLKNVKWIFVHNDTGGNNLKNVVESEDGSSIVNDMNVRGQIASTGPVTDDASIDFHKARFQERPSLSTSVDIDIINAFANAEIVYRSYPRITYSLTPKSGSADNVPRLFRDFKLGDITYLTARRGSTQVNDQAIRIFGCDLTIDENNVETITRLQTSFS